MVHYCHTLGLVYIEVSEYHSCNRHSNDLFLWQHYIIKGFYNFLAEVPDSKGLKSVLSKLGNLFSIWSLNKHAGLLYQGTCFNIVLFIEIMFLYRWILCKWRRDQISKGIYPCVV